MDSIDKIDVSIFIWEFKIRFLVASLFSTAFFPNCRFYVSTFSIAITTFIPAYTGTCIAHRNRFLFLYGIAIRQRVKDIASTGKQVFAADVLRQSGVNS
jgi:hypothetical protein